MGAVAHDSEANVEPGRCFRFVHDAAKATPGLAGAYPVPRTGFQDGPGGATRSGRGGSERACASAEARLWRWLTWLSPRAGGPGRLTVQEERAGSRRLEP